MAEKQYDTEVREYDDGAVLVVVPECPGPEAAGEPQIKWAAKGQVGWAVPWVLRHLTKPSKKSAEAEKRLLRSAGCNVK